MNVTVQDIASVKYKKRRTKRGLRNQPLFSFTYFMMFLFDSVHPFSSMSKFSPSTRLPSACSRILKLIQIQVADVHPFPSTTVCSSPARSPSSSLFNVPEATAIVGFGSFSFAKSLVCMAVPGNDGYVFSSYTIPPRTPQPFPWRRRSLQRRVGPAVLWRLWAAAVVVVISAPLSFGNTFYPLACTYHCV